MSGSRLEFWSISSSMESLESSACSSARSSAAASGRSVLSTFSNSCVSGRTPRIRNPDIMSAMTSVSSCPDARSSSRCSGPLYSGGSTSRTWEDRPARQARVASASEAWTRFQ
eukprot:9504133-Pyramimonas_sp.AAC.1